VYGLKHILHVIRPGSHIGTMGQIQYPRQQRMRNESLSTLDRPEHSDVGSGVTHKGTTVQSQVDSSFIHFSLQSGKMKIVSEGVEE
jgi:hypothetical protein